ncbi:MAG: hypothetical protein CMJ18_01090 [Phycisphaeraceae bacterium]|nr:hypothetical protein [Phycisphaeraceae bacterium]
MNVAAGASVTLNRPLNLPAATDPFWQTLGEGTYTIGMVIDSGDAVAEHYETNNSNRGVGLDRDDVAIVFAPDLRGAHFDVLTGTVNSGGVVDIELRIANDGSVDSGPFLLWYYLSPDATIGDAGDHFFLSQQLEVPASSVSNLISISPSLPDPSDPFWQTQGDGTYYIGVVIDGADDVLEGDETNNDNVGDGLDRDAFFVRTSPDLVGDTFDVMTGTVNAGGTVDIELRIANDGPVDSGPFLLWYYLSPDATIGDAGDHFFLSQQLEVPASSVSNLISISPSLPDVLDPFWQTQGDGTYYIGVVIDGADAVVEGDETNNDNVGDGIDRDSFSVRTSADLVGDTFNVVPDSVGAGEEIEIEFAIANPGPVDSGSFVIQLFISTDATIDAGSDRILGSHGSSVAADSVSSVIMRTLTLPESSDTFWQTVGDGTYTVGMIIDSSQDVPESDEDNNRNVGAGIDRDTVDVGVTPGEITGTKWHDLDGDGVRDPGEPGLSGWTIYLDENDNRMPDAGEPTDVTDANGDYQLLNVAPGTHVIAEVVQPGWTQTSPGPRGWYDFEDGAATNRLSVPGALPDLTASSVTFTDGDALLDADTDYLELGQPLGASPFTVFVDATYVPASPKFVVTQAASNVSTEIDFSIQQFPNTNVQTTFRNAAGVAGGVNNGDLDGARHQFAITWDGSRVGGFFDTSLVTNGVPGDIPDIDGSVVRFGDRSFGDGAGLTGAIHDIRIFDTALSEADLAATARGDGIGQAVFVGGGQAVSDVDFGNSTTGEIRGTKWNDLDGDGARDPGEPGLSGWTIYLDENENGLLDAGEPAQVTDADGDYVFTDVSPGAHVVREVAQSGWMQTSPGPVAVGWYDFEDGSAANRASVTGALPDLAASSVTFAGGDALLDADTDHLELGQPLGASPFTIYVDATYVPVTPRFVVTQAAGNVSTDIDFSIQQFPGTTVQTTFRNAAGTAGGVNNGDLDGARHQLAITWDGSRVGGFFDTSLVTNTVPGDIPDIDGSVVRFGDRSLNDGVGLTGSIHEIRIFDAALNEDDLVAMARGDGIGRSVVVDSGAIVEDVDFGNHGLGAISGTKWHDLNGDGVRDPGEDGLDGWTIFHDVDGDGQPDPGEPADVTDSSGAYQLTGLPPGTLEIAESFGGAPSDDVLVSGGLNEPRGMALSPDGLVLWTTSRNPFALHRFDAQTGASLGDVPTSDDVYDMTFGPDGHLYTVSQLSPDINRYDGQTGAALGMFALGGTGSQKGLAFSPHDGHLYVSNQALHIIQRFDGQTGQLLDNLPSGTAPQRLEFGPDGDLYVLGDAPPSVFRHDGPSGALQGMFASLAGGQPRDLTFGPDGDLYVAVAQANSVQRYDGNGGAYVEDALPNMTGGMMTPFALEFVEAGALLVASFGTDSILRFDEVVSTWVPTEPDTGLRQVPLDPGGSVANIDFGNTRLGAIRGMKFNDLDGDGTRDDGEPALEGFAVFIDANGNGDQDAGEPARVTDALGRYEFGDLLPGDYDLVEVPQSGWTQTTANPVVALSSGEIRREVNFGNVQPDGSIRGTKWEDVDGDGERDAGEPVVPGWTFYLDENDNGQLDAGEPARVTDAAGEYLFENLGPGTHIVAEAFEATQAASTFVDAGEGGLALARAMRFGPDPSEVLVGGRDSGVNRYDAQTGTFIASFVVDGPADDLNGLSDFVYGPDGHLYVSSVGNDQILRYDGETGAFMDVFASGSGLSVPHSFVFSPHDGHLLVASLGTDQILRFDGETGAYINIFGGLAQPSDLAFGPDGHLYASSFSSGGIFRLDGQTGALIGSLVQPATFVIDPIDFVFGPDGDLYVSDAGNDTVQQFDGTTGAYRGAAVAVGLGGLDYPHRLTFGDDGTLYVASFNSGEVLRYTDTAALWAPTDPISGEREVVLGEDEMASGIDFGNTRLGVILGIKWHDVDGDGIRDAGERGLGGWTIFLDIDLDGVHDLSEPFRVTDANGAYAFTGLLPGDYRVAEEFQAGWSPTAPASGVIDIALTSGDLKRHVDFGNEVDVTGPRVTEVLVRGSGWSQAMLDLFELEGVGTGGYSIPAGAAQFDPLPYPSLDELLIRFDEDVSVPADALVVSGVNVTDYFAADLSYDPSTFTATWILGLQPDIDRVLIHLDDSVVDGSGNNLDGEWINGVSSISGDGMPGGGFLFDLNVVVADLDQNATVGTGDLQIVLANFTRAVPIGDFTQGDYAGDSGGPDGVVGTTDLGTLLSRFTQGLPVIARSAEAMSVASTQDLHIRQRASVDAFVRAAAAARDGLLRTDRSFDSADAGESILDRWRRRLSPDSGTRVV